MLIGTVYGVVLNDSEERNALRTDFDELPYRVPPIAPVMYIKPKNCIANSPTQVSLLQDHKQVELGATIGLIFGQDAVRETTATAFSKVAAMCLVADVAGLHDSYYRPVISERCRDNYLPCGPIRAFDSALLKHNIITIVDGVERHRWSLQRSDRDAAKLIADVSSFMTFAAGDMVLLGLPGDAPTVYAGQDVVVEAAGFSRVTLSLRQQVAA